MKNRNKLGFLAVAILTLLVFNSCKKEFEELNKNPNEAETVTPDYLLTYGLKYSIYRYWDVEANMDGGLLIVQHWAKVQYPDEDAYVFRASSYQNIWDGFYAGGAIINNTGGNTGGIKDFITLSEIGQKIGNPNYVAIGKIMSSWLYTILTDSYGDIPYSEAMKIESNVTPKYDPQGDVYKGVLAELKAASEMINTGGNPISGDILYDGDMTKWRKFANSLRLRVALRIADRDAATAKSVFDDVAAKGNVVISSNDDIAQLFFTSFPSNNPINENRKTRADHRVSKTLVDKLKALSDPRLPIYAAKPKDNSINDYVGIPNGLSADSALKWGVNRTSDAGEYFTKADAPGVIMTYAEVLFAQAEAVQRGFIAGNAADLYRQAITASLKQYGISDANVLTYLAQPATLYDPTNYKKSIGEQKWIALYGQGLEAWAEWRRLDYPQLTPGPEASIAQPPYRLRYPAGEQSLNLASYTEAVSRQGADALTTKLWFDVN